MIEPWQVWKVQLSNTTNDQHVLVISSNFHLRLGVGRTVIVVPLAEAVEQLRYRPLVQSVTGTIYAVLADQIRTILSTRLVGTQPQWTLPDGDIFNIRRVLNHMVAF